MPVEGIVVDGDLSDWPEEMREYPIELPEYGVAPKDSVDFQGSFRIGFNEEENALYVAIEVRDESLVADETAGTEWDSKDGCEIYVDVGHRKEDVPVTQYAIRGENRSTITSVGEGVWENVEAEIQRSEGVLQYEWRIDIGEIDKEEIELRNGTLVGLDVVALDRDEDGSFSWMAWGPGVGKHMLPGRVGLVVLEEETGFGWLSIISWKEAATIATTVGVIISTLGLMLILRQLADARRFNRAQFVNTLDVDLKRYSPVYRKFLPGGGLYQAENYGLTFDERMDVLEYLGFYEKLIVQNEVCRFRGDICAVWW